MVRAVLVVEVVVEMMMLLVGCVMIVSVMAVMLVMLMTGVGIIMVVVLVFMLPACGDDLREKASEPSLNSPDNNHLKIQPEDRVTSLTSN
jgi:hypothetical protein